MQRQAAIAVIGCFRTTATGYAQAHANLMLMDLVLKDLCMRVITRMVSLHNEHHPLTKVVRHSSKRPVKRHPSPLHTLAKISGLHLGEVTPPPQLSLETVKKILFRTTVSKTRELSIEAERVTLPRSRSSWMAPLPMVEWEPLQSCSNQASHDT